ncbi:MAG: hypothetical protein ACI9GZ_002706 [Bacteroidia bacterium]|jgi:hypothetical protein
MLGKLDYNQINNWSRSQINGRIVIALIDSCDSII